MTNTFKKSLLIFSIVIIGGILNVNAYNHVGLANGTVELGTISTKPGAGNKFGKYQDGAYLYRGSAWSFSDNKGIKTQGSNSGVVFYLANSADITITVLFDASKNFADVDATLYTISDSDYDKFFNGTENNTAITFSKTQLEKRTINIDKKGSFQENFSSTPAGYYFLVCSGNGSNTYFTQLIVGGSTPITPTITSVTVSPTSKTLEINDTQQLTATVDATPATADKTVTWSTSDANVATVSTDGLVTAVAQGTANITATSNLDNTKSATCAITVNAPAAPIPVTAISLPATATVGIGATTTLTVSYTPADANTGKAVTWSSANENTATVDANGIVTGVAEGTATITASTVNGFTATCTVTVTSVPQTDLTLHVPEIYEGKSMDGGYDGTLTVLNGREYEVYYTERTANGDYPTFSTTLAEEGKTTGISGSTSEEKNVGRPGDTWFEGTIDSHSECKKATSEGEFVFETKKIREHRLNSSNKYQFHIKGFDQFSLWGMDKKIDAKNGNQVFVVKIDGVEQSMEYNTAKYTIRRFNLTTGEHLIEVSTTSATGTNTCYMGGFSLRVSDNPRTKYLKGNDTTQVILQTQAPLPVYYTTKNFSKGMPEILWEGNAAEGISLTSKAHDNLRDTSFITGVANCPIGEYKYYVITKANGVETSRSKQGKFSVIRKVEFQNKRDSAITIYQNTALTPIVINYYSTDDDALTWEWNGTQNTEISFTKDADANTLTISGTPQTKGTFQYTVHLTDAEDIHGQITVRSNKPTDIGADKTMLYLSKTDDLPSNGIFNELKGKYNYFPRAAAAGIAQTYEGYDFILISENVDADNEEALALIRGEIDKPVLNMKAFTYAPERVSKEGWGEPDNGTLDENDGLYITVQRDDHPIFKALNKKQGDKIKVLSQIDQKGLMPININHCDGSLALATAYPRDINDYYESAEYQQTILHEIPAGSVLRKGNSKYICMPIAMSSSNYITPEAKQLLAQVIDYLTSSESSTVSVPELKITSFSIDGVAAQIGNDTILLEMDTTAHSVDLSKAIPAITVASQYTHTEPMAGEEVNFMNSAWVPVVYTVTDFINRRTYDVIVRAYNPQGIDEVYTAGEWVNIYDVFGRMITTTNQDIYTMDLPRGMYIVVTANGGTLKIMK